MSRELRYVENPWRTRLSWLAYYAVMFIACFVVLYFEIGRIQLHTLPVGGIDLSVPYSKYMLGEDVSFTITNHFNGDVYVVNKCPEEPLGVYRQEGGKWVRIHDTTSKQCNAEDRQVSIPANKSLTMDLSKNWPHLFDKPGKYRVVMFVEYYNALPYQDFEIVPPPANVATIQSITNPTSTSSSRTKSKSVTSTSTSSSGGGTTSPSPTPVASKPSPTPSPTPTPSKPPAVTYTVHVTSAGVYDISSITLNAGDSIKFVYSPPIGNEVVTIFSPSTLTSVTLDSEFTSRTKTFTTTGTWTFRAKDHSGNTVVLKVQ